MELWTEYEGRTIDGAFPLTKLLRPEGRSAFFSTSNGTGVPTVIRLIESHFDDEEILARWRGVAALEHPNILKLDGFGQVILDDTSLVYAVMEPVDANLGDVVGSQRLTVPEVRQLASSLVAVLEALHSLGFVHEHVAPENVLAVGEVVKLRSDCIREAPEGNEGRALKKRDVHDMAVVLLEALTQQRTLSAANPPLPAPFDRIVPRGMSGEWGLAEISTALVDSAAPTVASTPAAVSEASAVPVPPTPLPAAAVPPKWERPTKSESEGATRSGSRTPRWTAVIALLVILAIWLGWHFLHHVPATQGAAAVPAEAVSAAQPAALPTPHRAAPARTQDPPRPGAQWRVVAYTYNYEAQAQHKTTTIAQKHPELQPEVFTPTGHAPYLVTIGGKMSRNEAFALAAKARGEGLPKDIYAQNYGREGR